MVTYEFWVIEFGFDKLMEKLFPANKATFTKFKI